MARLKPHVPRCPRCGCPDIPPTDYAEEFICPECSAVLRWEEWALEIWRTSKDHIGYRCMSCNCASHQTPRDPLAVKTCCPICALESEHHYFGPWNGPNDHRYEQHKEKTGESLTGCIPDCLDENTPEAVTLFSGGPDGDDAMILPDELIYRNLIPQDEMTPEERERDRE